MFSEQTISKDNLKQITTVSDVPNITIGTWNHLMTVEETVSYLSRHEGMTMAHTLEMCRIVSQAKKNFTGRRPIDVEDDNVPSGTKKNGVIEERKFREVDDWERFKKSVAGQVDEVILSRMIKIFESWDSGGSVKKIFQETGYLPASRNTLYEISTIDCKTNLGQAQFRDVISKIISDGEVSAKEIGVCKKDALLKLSKSAPSGLSPKIALKMPTKKESLKKLKDKWAEVEKALNKIQSLTKEIEGFELSIPSPDNYLAAKEAQEEQSAKNKIMNKCRSLCKKWSTKHFEALKDAGKTEKQKESIKEFFRDVEDYKMKAECKGIFDDYVKSLQENKNANTVFEKEMSGKVQSTLVATTLKASSGDENVSWEKGMSENG